jgi:uncharacterized Zn-finger protein
MNFDHSQNVIKRLMEVNGPKYEIGCMGNSKTYGHPRIPKQSPESKKNLVFAN